MQSSAQGRKTQNKNAIIRQQSVELMSEGKTHIIKPETENEKRETQYGTTHTIKVEIDDEDPGNAVLSLEIIANVFIEGVVLFDFGNIFVYFNLWTGFLKDIEYTATEEQKDISLLHDVYSSYKTFLLYQNTDGRVLILPRNQNFHTVFKRLSNVLQNNEKVTSNMVVRLKDINKPNHSCEQFKESGHVKHDQKYHHVNHVFARKLETRFNESESGENVKEEAETDLSYERNVSLETCKERTNIGRLKVNTPYLQNPKQLPWLPPSFPRDRIFIQYPFKELFQLPVQVSEEQRDDDQAHSEQVVTHNYSTIHRDDISFGLSQPSMGNNGVYSHVTNETQSAVQEPRSLLQHRPRVPPRHPNYSDYSDRLMSYTNWRHRTPDPPRLSQAGFFFTNQEDLVRCFQCGIGLKDFSPDDDPLLEHIRHSKQCPFLPELLGEDRLASYKERLQTIDPEYNRQQQWTARQNGSVPSPSYRHPEYQTMEARLSSFAMWPHHMKQTPQQLAEAGLYYTGFEDQVRCFACDGGLRRWDPEDDPWTEHCRWFPACPYALEQKGEQFIALIQASVENEGYGASGGGVQDVTSTMAQLKLRESVTESIMTQHRAVCLDMGYKEHDVKDAVKELLERGNETPSLEDIIVLIDVIRERKLNNGHSSANESPFEENNRLKNIVFCMRCSKNNVNALFLPCTHHELCMACAEPLNECPVCHREIREKIRTFMV
ncbi:baculoviral IAP repeat-containing protein 2-like [Mercenaria mercenaria]|uniref:baculoviral IAP repeat-containing protein 2-like n=1 Tax=Mercenaria mercenaria TaxID=6596 RepID=UPI00234F6516|nr:baculoviral IAP repeat-containing protein 2-like [Mercenaria mercenaria]XP_045174785.2 baculoviral IAP repeat-containing protein 2-like [Mercenaria mercenaria]